MVDKKNNYGQSSIAVLKGADQVRKKASVIFGTNDEDGAAHGIYEIIANSIDEAREGYGKQIRITIEKDGTVTVDDDGRGVPMGWNEGEKEWNWKLVFCTLYASGKYDSSNYGGSLGTNGLGATAMQFASEFMDVYSTRDGKTSYMHFEKGLPIGQLKEMAPIKEGTGTLIRFRPDPEVFSNIQKSVKSPQYYIDLLRKQAMLHAGLEIVLKHAELENPIVLYYPGGIGEFVDTICEKPMLKKAAYFEDTVTVVNEDQLDKTPFEFNERLAFNFSRDQSMVEMYHDGSHLFEGGETYEAMKIGVTKAFEQIAKDSGKLSSNGRFLYKDIENMFICIGDTNAPGHMTFFKNQTKGAVTNRSFGQAYMQFAYNSIRKWEKQDKLTVAKIVDEIIVNKTAREEAEKVSKKVVNSLSKSITGIGNKPKKFVDCKSRIPFERELWIVEGDSALGSCKLARESDFQAIMPVRGKILNCLKEDLSRALNSEIIIDLLRILGCGIEAKSKYIENLPPFDITKLNWGKIIICTDADLDGMQIRCLLLAMFYRLCPSLIKAGKVYIAETPLFEISYRNKVEFAYTEAEKDEIFQRFEAIGVDRNKLKVSRSKGLGENEPDMMNKSTMNPLTRRLVSIEYDENEELVAGIFESLLGNDLNGRKELIDEYFKITDVDID